MANGLLDDATEFLMDGFYWIKEKIHEVKDWIVRKSGL
jgi:hypothetical protein